jgi:hypothetical protein
VSTRSELEEVEVRNSAEGNAGEIADGKRQRRLIKIHNQWAKLLAVASVSGFTLSGTELLGVLGLLNISVGAEALEELDGITSLVDVGKRGIRDDERDLLELIDAVTTGEN